jgi:hypothetical protein
MNGALEDPMDTHIWQAFAAQAETFQASLRS